MADNITQFESVGGFSGANLFVSGATFTGNVAMTSTSSHTGLASFASGITASGATFMGNINLQNAEFIRNTTNGRIDFMPGPAAANAYGLYVDATSWTYGPRLGTIRSSDNATNVADINFETGCILSQDKAFSLNSSQTAKFIYTTTGNATLQMCVPVNSASTSSAVALITGDGMSTANRSPGITHTNPNLYIYAAGAANANDFIRFEHDRTNANIVTGQTSGILIQPGSGWLGISGGISAAGSTFTSIAAGNIYSNITTPSYPIYINNLGGSQTFIGDWDGNLANTFISVNDDNGDVTISAPTSGILTYGGITDDTGVSTTNGLNTSSLTPTTLNFIGGVTVQSILPSLSNTSTITLPANSTTLTGNSLANVFTALQTFNTGLTASGATFTGNVAMTSTSSHTGLASFAGGISGSGGFTFGNAGSRLVFPGLTGAQNGGYLWLQDAFFQIGGVSPTPGGGSFYYNPASERFYVFGAADFNQSYNYEAARSPLRLNVGPNHTAPILATYVQTAEGTQLGSSHNSTNMVAGIDNKGVIFSYVGLTASGATFTGLINGLRFTSGNGLTFDNTVVGATGAGIALTTGTNNFLAGPRAGDALTTGSRNVAIGTDALGAGVTTSDAIAIGHNALLLNTADSSIGIGSRALDAVTTGTNNIAIGVDAASAINTGTSNIAIGTNALKVATTVNDNVAIGYNALQAKSSSGGGNVALGTSALYRATTCQTSTAVGYQSQFGSASVTAQANSSLGYNSMVNIISGNYNSAFGINALYSLTGGSENTACGTESLYAITNTSNNTGVGQLSLRYTTTGSNNTAIGYLAGAYKTSSNTNHTTAGDWNVYIGGEARASGDSVTNEVVIGGNKPVGIGSNTTTIGTSATTATRLFGVISTGITAPTIASAATISPTARITFVSGVTTINTINPPTGITLTGGQITLIPTGLWSTGTSGNIALATTAVVNRALIMFYDAQTTKWYPSY